MNDAGFQVTRESVRVSLNDWYNRPAPADEQAEKDFITDLVIARMNLEKADPPEPVVVKVSGGESANP